MLLNRLLKRLRKFFLGYYLEIYYINGPDNLPAPLSREQETAIFMRLEEGDPKAKEILITHNLRLVVYIARKFGTLLQSGHICISYTSSINIIISHFCRYK